MRPDPVVPPVVVAADPMLAGAASPRDVWRRRRHRLHIGRSRRWTERWRWWWRIAGGQAEERHGESDRPDNGCHGFRSFRLAAKNRAAREFTDELVTSGLRNCPAAPWDRVSGSAAVYSKVPVASPE